MGVFSSYNVFKFATLLATPFTKWKLYVDGIIDAEGNKIDKDFKLDPMENLVRKIKKVLIHFGVPDKSSILTVVSAILIKEEKCPFTQLPKTGMKELREVFENIDEDEEKIMDSVIIMMLNNSRKVIEDVEINENLSNIKKSPNIRNKIIY